MFLAKNTSGYMRSNTKKAVPSMSFGTKTQFKQENMFSFLMTIPNDLAKVEFALTKPVRASPSNRSIVFSGKTESLCRGNMNAQF